MNIFKIISVFAIFTSTFGCQVSQQLSKPLTQKSLHFSANQNCEIRPSIYPENRENYSCERPLENMEVIQGLTSTIDSYIGSDQLSDFSIHLQCDFGYSLDTRTEHVEHVNYYLVFKSNSDANFSYKLQLKTERDDYWGDIFKISDDNGLLDSDFYTQSLCNINQPMELHTRYNRYNIKVHYKTELDLELTPSRNTPLSCEVSGFLEENNDGEMNLIEVICGHSHFFRNQGDFCEIQYSQMNFSQFDLPDFVFSDSYECEIDGINFDYRDQRRGRQFIERASEVSDHWISEFMKVERIQDKPLEALKRVYFNEALSLGE